MKKFVQVSSQVTLPQLEDEINQFWKENKTFEKSLEQRKDSEPYVFVDGPPFVTGIPHYGSILPSIAKDLIPRYQTMLGKKVRRVWGWDCHGLPIEQKINEKLGIKSRDQLENEIGIERYIEECRTYINGVTSDWRWYIEKIGRWVDLDNAYFTMKPEYMETVIWVFKQTYEKGLIYKGKRVSLFSTDTSTPVSNFEVAMDADNYRDVEDLSIFVKFALNSTPEFLKDKNPDNKQINMLAWTTTPWTIPSNMALAVNEGIDYVLVEYDNEWFVLSKDRLEYTFDVKSDEIGNAGDSRVKILHTFRGKELEGLSYKPVYEFFVGEGVNGIKVGENDFKVYLFDEVSNEEGTGVLHIAPAFGEADYALGQAKGISAIADIDESGNMIVGEWKGMYLREASPMITEDLEKKGSLLRSKLYIHRLPFYRGDNPLIYMAQEAYFIDIQKIKGRLLELNQDINWIPKHIKDGRFAETIESAPDWCISRNRYWATIMPIWRAEDGEEIVVGSIEEMASFTTQIQKGDDGKYYFEGKPMDLHRDVCDKIVLKKGDKEFRRIPEVLDVWMDSGSVPMAEYHYPFENKELFEKSRPADFIIEYVGQVRAWFNVLHRVSTIIFDDKAFKNVICTGVLAGNDGRKMSKSYGNYPDPKMVIEKYGADALRLYMMSSPIMLGEDMNFYEEGVADNYKFLLVLWNSYKYFIDYASVFDWSCDLPGLDDKSKLSVLDRWILAKLTKLVLGVRKSLDNYNIPEASRFLKEFLVNDYSTWYVRRSRDRVSSNPDEMDRNICLSVMYGVLVTYCKVAAPVIPFITEAMYRNLTEDESVHLTEYPKGDESLLNDKLVNDMVFVRKIAEAGLAKRKETAIKLRQPLASLKYKLNIELDDDLEKILAEELNVKRVDFEKSVNLEPEVELDINLTPELQKEGEAREVIRQIQQLRKEANLTLADKTVVEAPAWPKEFEQYILDNTASVSIKEAAEFKVTKA